MKPKKSDEHSARQARRPSLPAWENVEQILDSSVAKCDGGERCFSDSNIKDYLYQGIAAVQTIFLVVLERVTVILTAYARRVWNVEATTVTRKKELLKEATTSVLTHHNHSVSIIGSFSAYLSNFNLLLWISPLSFCLIVNKYLISINKYFQAAWLIGLTVNIAYMMFLFVPFRKKTTFWSWEVFLLEQTFLVNSQILV